MTEPFPNTVSVPEVQKFGAPTEAVDAYEDDITPSILLPSPENIPEKPPENAPVNAPVVDAFKAYEDVVEKDEVSAYVPEIAVSAKLAVSAFVALIA